MGLSAFYGEVPKSDEERFAVFDAALASGAFHIDTSDFYADSQELIGRWLKSDPSLRSKVSSPRSATTHLPPPTPRFNLFQAEQ